MARRRLSLRRLEDEVATRFPEITDPAAEIASGRIAVDGRVAANPATRVRIDAAVSRRVDVPLRGEAKLRAALAAFSLDVTGRVALDCGAAAGGFTRVLLAAGASRVYAVDAGFGQLRGSLRADARVVTMERTNIGRLDARRVPEPVGVVTLDLSYLAITQAVPQLGRLRFTAAAIWSRS
jgi:23S rRNA (cytidine1920-2'-O)/16S rRNA (cytidine1409-2'-O)-methyltransferase